MTFPLDEIDPDYIPWINNTNSDLDYSFYDSSSWQREYCETLWLRGHEGGYEEFIQTCMALANQSTTTADAGWMAGFKNWLLEFVANNASHALGAVQRYMNSTSKTEFMLDVTESILEQASESATHWTPSLPDDTTTQDPTTPVPSTKGESVTYPILLGLGAASWIIPIAYFAFKRFRGKN